MTIGRSVLKFTGYIHYYLNLCLVTFFSRFKFFPEKNRHLENLPIIKIPYKSCDVIGKGIGGFDFSGYTRKPNIGRYAAPYTKRI